MGDRCQSILTRNQICLDVFVQNCIDLSLELVKELFVVALLYLVLEELIQLHKSISSIANYSQRCLHLCGDLLEDGLLLLLSDSVSLEALDVPLLNSFTVIV